MELKQLKTKSTSELREHLLALQKEQFSLRMQKATGQLPPAKTNDPKRVRREIARVNFLIGAAAKKQEA
jgi:large subunit ribosomal protein L29